MKTGKLNALLTLVLAFIITFTVGICLIKVGTAAAEEEAYEGAYRNRLSFSAKKGWNNDPNGLLYVENEDGTGGTYHMYYQYNYNQGVTENIWGHMSWGHATSTDLVHWEEQEVAIPEGLDGYGMMFSGSAVYDKHNTSGLFNEQGSGIVAILTQPDDSKGGQRQILAYSTDGTVGNEFKICGQILGKGDDGVEDMEVNDRFRDPKVFWSEKHNKWLMAVGGGAVRMYSSDNLKDWTYLGQTGFWGECPDISRYEVDGVEKYVLIISPEDKNESHEYNKTTRADTYYPAEYYVVGDLDKNGLFKAEGQLKRLSEGIDSYAFQSFNNVPDGKVYGVSWSASWKTVDYYKDYRQTHNGGMTVVTELNLIEKDGEYSLTRIPVEGYEELRGNEPLKTVNKTLNAGSNALAGVRADVADIEIVLDFNGSSATYAELGLRVSAVERILVRYDVNSELLTLDRSQSSLLAKNTPKYQIAYQKQVSLNDGKLSLRILLDRAFISVFANGGEASFFSAVFPSPSSKAMTLMVDGDVKVKADVYAMDSIFENIVEANDLFVTTDKIDVTVGSINAVITSSFASNFNGEEVRYSITAGSEFISLQQVGEIAYVKGLKEGSATVHVAYGGQSKDIAVYIHNNGFESQVDYEYKWGEDRDGYSYIASDGLHLSIDQTQNAFRFSNKQGKDIIYSAQFTPANAQAQAGGLVFGASENFSSYWVATADVKDNKIKLWQAGIGDLKTADYAYEQGKPIKLTVVVSDSTAKVYVNDSDIAIITQKLDGYHGGRLGLNVYNGEMIINNVTFTDMDVSDGFYFGGLEIEKVINVTDGSYKLQDSDYTVVDGVLIISDDYLRTLEENTEYTFRVFTAFTEFNVKLTTSFPSYTVSATKNSYSDSEEITLILNGETEVYRVEIDGVVCEFTLEGTRLTVKNEVVKNLSKGSHTIKVYTKNGRPTAKITVTSTVTPIVEPEKEISYTFLIVDLVIFGSCIIGYVIFSIVSKRKQH